MIITFTHGLHDEDSDALRENIYATASADFEVSDDLMDKIGRPFFEVTLTCTLDTETGKVTLVSTELPS
jgi:hypothetical protein